jgi:hypothetical protein
MNGAGVIIQSKFKFRRGSTCYRFETGTNHDSRDGEYYIEIVASWETENGGTMGRVASLRRY